MSQLAVSRVPDSPISGAAQDNRAQATQLIRQATDPRSGAVDTQQLAQWTVDAQRTHPENASEAYAAIEAELANQNPIDAGNFAREVVSASQQPPEQGNHGPAPSGQWATGQYLANRGDRTLINNPILEKRWEFTQSAWTSKGGPTGPLKTLLESHGISVVPGVNTPPSGSLNASQAAARGSNLQQANNLNGSLARDAIANRFSAQGLPTQTEVPRLGGQRIVDVVADVPANDPRYATRIETESKVGRTGATSGSSGTRAQAAKDAAQLLDNRSVRAGGELLAKAGRVVRPIGIALDALNVAQAFRDDGNRIGENTGRAASGLVGGAAGAWGGAAAGAAIGSVVPGVGTLVGGIIGGIIGGLAGDAAGKGLFDGIKSLF